MSINKKNRYYYSLIVFRLKRKPQLKRIGASHLNQTPKREPPRFIFKLSLQTADKHYYYFQTKLNTHQKGLFQLIVIHRIFSVQELLKKIIHI